jgi:hypothetical protein
MNRSLVIGCVFLGCGASDTTLSVDSNPRQLCTKNDALCVSLPAGALKSYDRLSIREGVEGPGAALSATYEVSLAQLKGALLEKPAKVSFSFDAVTFPPGVNESLLRVFTFENGEWVGLQNASIDRTLRRISGETLHFSPFVVLRIDRLSDGGLPVEINGGARDGGVIVLPPFDSGTYGFDAGLEVPDASMIDAGVDAGPPRRDAGTPDAGKPDAGVVDAGFDAGRPDAGPSPMDSGSDAGSAPDAGTGSSDAGDGG